LGGNKKNVIRQRVTMADKTAGIYKNKGAGSGIREKKDKNEKWGSKEDYRSTERTRR